MVLACTCICVDVVWTIQCSFRARSVQVTNGTYTNMEHAMQPALICINDGISYNNNNNNEINTLYALNAQGLGMQRTLVHELLERNTLSQF